MTLGGLARRAMDLFWPLASAAAGFARPQDPPVFLTLETAQYYMSRQAERVDYYDGFQDLRISPPRLASQVLDNLNKSAVVGFPMDEIAERLKAAWDGPADQARIYDSAQSAARGFRDYCLAHNLLDFSLQTEIFRPAPAAAARGPALPLRPLPPPHRRQRGRGHARRPRPAARVAALAATRPW